MLPQTCQSCAPEATTVSTTAPRSRNRRRSLLLSDEKESSVPHEANHFTFWGIAAWSSRTKTSSSSRVLGRKPKTIHSLHDCPGFNTFGQRRVTSNAPPMLPANPYSSGCLSASFTAPYPPIETPATPRWARPVSTGNLDSTSRTSSYAMASSQRAFFLCFAFVYQEKPGSGLTTISRSAMASFTALERSCISAGLLIPPGSR